MKRRVVIITISILLIGLVLLALSDTAISAEDTGIVLRATYPASLFDKDPAKRLEINEIISMPISKKWLE